MSKAPWSTGELDASLVVPAGSVDSHIHIYDDRFAYDPAATLRPAQALVRDYRLLQKRLSLARVVIVQPSSYGDDNRCLVDALGQLGDNARGIAVINASTTDAELKAMNAAGVRGIRFNLSRPAGAPLDLLGQLARRVEPLGWHVQVHAMGDSYPSLENALIALPTPIVIDHLGRIPPGEGVKHPAWNSLRRIVDTGRAWVKVSGAYHDSVSGAPHYTDSGALVKAWLAHAPERTVWGTDWPHPSAMAGEKPMPDDAILMDRLADWLPARGSLRKLMVENPERLYGFAPFADQA